jgi:hypothetical protein
MLAAVAGALARLPASIVTLRVVEREGPHAVDEICLETDETLAEELRLVVERVGSVTVESVRAIDRLPDPLAALELADRLARRIGRPVQELVSGLPDALTCAWSIAIDIDRDGGVLAASANAPVPGMLDTPWAPLDGARRLPEGAWMPQRWKMLRYELAAAPLDAASHVVIVGRWAGMRFRPTELRQLELLTEMAAEAEREPSRTILAL